MVFVNKRLSLRLLGSGAALIVVLQIFNRFVNYVEQRPGVVLADPLLALLPPQDATWLIFALIYGALGFGVFLLARRPERLVVALQAYALLVVARMALMWVAPLDPPAGMIILRDPLVELFGENRVLTRDLFFSGHTSLLFLLALTAEGRRERALFGVSTLFVGALLLLQHVHYSLDVLAAPFMSFCCVKASHWINRSS